MCLSFTWAFHSLNLITREDKSNGINKIVKSALFNACIFMREMAMELFELIKKIIISYRPIRFASG